MLWLVRHAQVELDLGERPDRWRLSAEGRAAAEELALRLPRVATVVSSPEPKAVETAEPIARANAVELRLDERLREVWREASFPTYEQHADAVRRYLAGEPIAGWEGRAEAAARIGAAVAGLDDAVVVTHGTVLALLLDLSFDQWQAIRLPDVIERRIDSE
jgi:probable phosphoglycerate mutase